MSFLTGKTKEMIPGDVKNLRGQIGNYITRQGIDTAIQGVDQPIDLAPFQEMFAQRRQFALAQAKEAAGNLTGSGLGNTLGTAAGRSVSEENAFLASLLENARQRSADRFLELIGQVPSLTGQMAHQPGFLDYLFQGAQSAAPLIAAA